MGLIKSKIGAHISNTQNKSLENEYARPAWNQRLKLMSLKANAIQDLSRSD